MTPPLRHVGPTHSIRDGWNSIFPKTLLEFDERFGMKAVCREYPFVWNGRKGFRGVPMIMGGRIGAMTSRALNSLNWTRLERSDLLAGLIGGRSLHNNHHAYPRAPSSAWGASSSIGVVIRVPTALRVVKLVAKG